MEMNERMHARAPQDGALRAPSPYSPGALVIPAKAGTYPIAPRLRASGNLLEGARLRESENLPHRAAPRAYATAGTYPYPARPRNREPTPASPHPAIRATRNPPAKRGAAPRGAAPRQGASPDGYAAASSSLSPLSPVAPDSAESLSAPQLLPNHPPCPRPPLNP